MILATISGCDITNDMARFRRRDEETAMEDFLTELIQERSAANGHLRTWLRLHFSGAS